MKKIILGIESSCDETSASIIEGQESKVKILSNIVSSQIETHKRYGGVVPEVASRAHLESVNIVIEDAFKKAKKDFKDIDAISVTCGPGLSGSLVVGVSAAKIIAKILRKPLVCVNHLEGHIYANFIDHNKEIKFPVISLIVSGGHTQILKIENHHKYEKIGDTKDDAAGEAFDKVARILGLGYPGGAKIEKLAKKGNEKRYNFPRSEMHSSTVKDKEGFLVRKEPNLSFSFSGLKTAVLYEVRKSIDLNKADVAASFQKAVIDVLVTKTIWAAQRNTAKAIMISGGVSANKKLVNTLKKEAKKNDLNFYSPSLNLSTDNAAMIAIAGYFRFLKKSDERKVSVNPNLKL